MVSIEDCGGGVEGSELPLLKEKFKRGSNTKNIEGAGLGLYISDYCMKKMNGRLDGNPLCHALPAAALCDFTTILGGAVTSAVWFASRRIKKIEPIVALRSGIQTHNFKSNRVLLEKTKAPLNFALALKTALSGVKLNVTVCITMLVLSLIVVFSGLMTRNVILDRQPFVNLIIGETADSCISVQAEAEDDFLRERNTDSCVEKLYLYTSLKVSHVGGAELMATLCDDFSNANNQSVVFEGRFPKYDNEIIGTLMYTSYYLNLLDGTDIDAFNSEMKGIYGGKVNSAINIQAILDGTGGVYVSLM